MYNLVRDLRTQRGLSQGGLGEALGVSRQTVNAIETGKYDPSLPLAIGIARFFGLSVEDVFLLDGPPSSGVARSLN
ncbi:MAG: putative transcriptional regulator [Actinomycetota bacterium]|nr:putative transcriptional regulator [Actinomycetota bacterium]